MNKKNNKNQTWIRLASSVLLIVLSTQIRPEGSTLLGVLQTLMLGVGMVGCCLAIWKFSKGGKNKG
ncbi:hypothetical protein PaeBR_02370 [Paenibacillus sp. BR2-3]|uniref:hypothetical protein n=1 Tax=Paenibacillus sp. BR2-3 TaxID=3048494 RepID=UPI0039777DB8